MSAIKELTLRAVSPLKKVKRKIGYGDEVDEVWEESRRRLKKISLQDHAANGVEDSMSTC